MDGVADHWAELASEGATMLPGPEPDTALRVRVEGCARGGCVHLEQVAYSHTVGWYRQKAFTIPREMIGDLSRLLRMGDCLLPAPAERTHAAASATACTNPLPFKPPTHQTPPSTEPGRRSG